MVTVCYLDNFIKYSEDEVQKRISKLKPLKYNKFFWWRLFTDNHEPLGKRAPLKDRIINGDFDEPTFKWQAQWVLINARKKLNFHRDTYRDHIEKTSLDFARFKKLMQDYEKEEQKRLAELLNELKQVFKLTDEQFEYHLDKWKGDTLSFYEYLYKIFPTSAKENRKENKKINGKNKSKS